MPIAFLNKEISGPYTIPSGIVATALPVLERLANESLPLGVLTTKSISKEPKKGNLEPIFAQVGSGIYINAVGLANAGAEKFAEQLSKIKIPKDKFLLASIVGSNVEDFKFVAEQLKNYVDGFEINVSCPHAAGHGQAIGHDFELVTKIIKSVKELDKPVLVKLSPRIDVNQSMDAVLAGDADGVVAINTWGPKEYKVDGYDVLSNKVGGISGTKILKEGLRVVREIRKRTSILPIIGMGGIRTASDILDYQEAGADIFGIGSALVGMNTPDLIDYFNQIDQDVRCGTNFARYILNDTTVNMEYKKLEINKNEKLATDLFKIKFKDSIDAKSGQFVMLWIPETGEKPFSVYNDQPLEILYQTRGCFTNALSNIDDKQKIYYRGPYGKSPDIKGKKLLLVGGGTGLAGLTLFSKDNKCFYVVGAKDKDHLPDGFKEPSSNKIIYTEDGSAGKKGLVTSDLGETIKRIQPDYVLNCGPMPMIEAALDIETKHLDPENILSSKENTTMCGNGACGRCATLDGLRSCVDGPFM